MIGLALALVLTPAHAQDCDAKALRAELKDAPPVRIGTLFSKLAACDAGAARKAAPEVLPRLLADRDAPPVLIAAIRAGAGADVRTWLQGQEPDLRSRAITGIGDGCADDAAAVGGFFVSSASALGDAFWEDRWHRGLGTCRTPEVRALLTGALSHPLVGRQARNVGMHLGLLEIYGRNLGAEALPTLDGYLSEAQDEEQAAILVNVLADVGGVGSNDADPAVRKQVVETIAKHAPNLPERALVRARATLTSLGDDAAAGALARWAYADRWSDDGGFTYGLGAVEKVTCKNGKVRARLHLGTVREDGTHWADQVTSAVEARAKQAWTFDAAAACKGTSTVSVRVTDAPVDAAALAAWTDAQREDFARTFADAQKTEVVEHDAVAW